MFHLCQRVLWSIIILFDWPRLGVYTGISYHIFFPIFFCYTCGPGPEVSMLVTFSCQEMPREREKAWRSQIFLKWQLQAVANRKKCNLIFRIGGTSRKIQNTRIRTQMLTWVGGPSMFKVSSHVQIRCRTIIYASADWVTLVHQMCNQTRSRIIRRSYLWIGKGSAAAGAGEHWKSQRSSTGQVPGYPVVWCCMSLAILFWAFVEWAWGAWCGKICNFTSTAVSGLS